MKTVLALLAVSSGITMSACTNEDSSSDSRGPSTVNSASLQQCSGNLAGVHIYEFEDEGTVAWEAADTGYGFEPYFLQLRGGPIQMSVSLEGDRFQGHVRSNREQSTDLAVNINDDSVQVSFPAGYARDMITAANSDRLEGSASLGASRAYCS